MAVPFNCESNIKLLESIVQHQFSIVQLIQSQNNRVCELTVPLEALPSTKIILGSISYVTFHGQVQILISYYCVQVLGSQDMSLYRLLNIPGQSPRHCSEVINVYGLKIDQQVLIISFNLLNL